jgi:calcineurin-like phosphoesterase family protein
MVYILGDVTMEKKTYEILNRLNGLKNVILGNHDARNHVPELLKHVNSVAGMVDYKNKCILTHCPIHPQELSYRYKYNIHGHVHEKPIYRKLFGFKLFRDRRYVNVSCEVLNYTPIEF